ncbi:hypothetical protein [Adhaeribacter radiodurans]|uniref:Immunity protein 30 domain-containing protein n=1 Tax=Adhaeribacter radiodurans TaxID=2745197 RepID=A0A7L7L1D0_9BACT|nr:hypothetical protein [Adhaeribacter radiodurans]QMU26596.1 hypothetical protein HUW48_00555 [Adhaeribacter radiodurans]
MKKTVEIIEELKRFIPVDEDAPESNDILLDNILEDLFENEDAHLVIPSLFELMENYPDVDFGAPGTIVHTLETFDGQYEEQLYLSLKREPTVLSVLMLNRIINSLSDPKEKNENIELLRQISISDNINENAKEEARSFYDYQLKNLVS